MEGREEEEASVSASAPASSTTTPDATEDSPEAPEDSPEASEEAPPPASQDGWQRMRILRPWRQGQQLFLMTARNGGYIINYSFVPARVSKWLNYGAPQNITPLPSNVRLLYKFW